MNMKTMKANKGVKKLIREINRPIKIESKRYGNGVNPSEWTMS